MTEWNTQVSKQTVVRRRQINWMKIWLQVWYPNIHFKCLLQPLSFFFMRMCKLHLICFALWSQQPTSLHAFCQWRLGWPGPPADSVWNYQSGWKKNGGQRPISLRSDRLCQWRLCRRVRCTDLLFLGCHPDCFESMITCVTALQGSILAVMVQN